MLVFECFEDNEFSILDTEDGIRTFSDCLDTRPSY